MHPQDCGNDSHSEDACTLDDDPSTVDIPIPVITAHVPCRYTGKLCANILFGVRVRCCSIVNNYTSNNKKLYKGKVCIERRVEIKA